MVLGLDKFFLNPLWVLEHGGCLSSILWFIGSDCFSVDLVISTKSKDNRSKITSRLKGCGSWIRTFRSFVDMMEGISFCYRVKNTTT